MIELQGELWLSKVPYSLVEKLVIYQQCEMQSTALLSEGSIFCKTIFTCTTGTNGGPESIPWDNNVKICVCCEGTSMQGFINGALQNWQTWHSNGSILDLPLRCPSQRSSEFLNVWATNFTWKLPPNLFRKLAFIWLYYLQSCTNASLCTKLHYCSDHRISQ